MRILDFANVFLLNIVVKQVERQGRMLPCTVNRGWVEGFSRLSRNVAKAFVFFFLFFFPRPKNLHRKPKLSLFDNCEI